MPDTPATFVGRKLSPWHRNPDMSDGPSNSTTDSSPGRCNARWIGCRLLLLLVAAAPVAIASQYAGFQAAQMVSAVRADARENARMEWEAAFKESVSRNVLMPIEAASRDLASLRHHLVSRPPSEPYVDVDLFPVLDLARGVSNPLETGVYASAYAQLVRTDEEALELDEELNAVYGEGSTLRGPQLPSRSPNDDALVLTGIRPSRISAFVLGADLLTGGPVGGTDAPLRRTLISPWAMFTHPLNTAPLTLIDRSLPLKSVMMQLPVHLRDASFVASMRAPIASDASVMEAYDYADRELPEDYDAHAHGLAFSLIDPERLFGGIDKVDGETPPVLQGTTIVVQDATPADEFEAVNERASLGFRWCKREMVSDHEQAALDCGSVDVSSVLWTNAGVPTNVNFDEVCEPYYTSPEMTTRLILLAGGRIWSFIAMTDGAYMEAAGDAAAAADDRADTYRKQALVIGSTITLLISSALALMQFRAASESERGHRRAAEAAR
eukprot:CAMPEP_0203829754 /NCGR_PEP_ID=MMETSP0115-20131106/64265_1 /ASSEMBLY_ACC=CAM_ASM_000227 /TAXON_ID=33651 /ORGANISM="Bicosoecid sp, Strain ms1" /LENGTH=496 /DNA_ID=CAMNT_0050738815 /DNA_START=24 /DNA_END=1510 /DNA_ORIENTATION=-